MTISSVFKNALEQQYDLAQLLTTTLVKSNNCLSFINRDEIKSISYRDFYSDIRVLAGSLQEKGVVTGQIVIICCDDEEQLVKAFWATQLIGAIAAPLTVPMSFSSEDDALKKLLSVYHQCPGAVLLTDLDSSSIDRLSIDNQKIDSRQIIFIDTLIRDLGFTSPKRQPDEIAMLMFSSGSTGDPKGVCLTHKNLLTNLWQISERSELTEQDSSLSWLPLTHDMGLVLFHMCHTLAGLNQHKMSALSFVRDPKAFLKYVSRNRISLLGMPNFGFDTILRSVPQTDAQELDLSSVRAIYNGAEPIDPKLIRRFYNHFENVGLAPTVISPGYGIAECCVVATQHPHHQLIELNSFPTLWVKGASTAGVGDSITVAEPGEIEATELVSLGPVMDGMSVRITDNNDQQLLPLQVGHIQFSGDNVTPGYWGKESSKWCQTGDLGFIWNNHVYISGRAKDVLFINGKNYFSNDLENRLCQRVNWQANQLAVVGYRSSLDDKEQVAIFFRKDKKAKTDTAQVLKNELESLMSFPVSKVIGLSALPKTTSGKIRRFQLREGLISGLYTQNEITLDNQNTHQYSERERWIWSQVCLVGGIQISNPDITAPLSRYGLDSIGWTQLTQRINTLLGLNLRLNELIEAQSIQHICNLLPEEIIELDSDCPLTEFDEVLLSENQYALWSSYLLESNKALYNENYSLRFNANLDVKRFESAVSKVLKKHKILNVNVNDTSTPKLVVNLNQRIDYGFSDYSNKKDKLESELENISHTAFDLRQESPIRLRLYQVGLNEYCLFISAHHLVMDGWSFSILIQDIFSEYETPSKSSSEIGLLQISPAETDLEEEGYWKGLAKSVEPYDIPQLSTEREKEHSTCSMVRFKLSHELYDSIKQVNEKHRTTTYSVFASAISLIFSKLSDITKPVLGTLVANRHHPEDFNRIGFYAQTQPLTVAIQPGDSLLSLSNELSNQTTRLISGPSLSLNQINSLTGVDFSALLDVVYVHQNTPPFVVSENIQLLSRQAYRSQARTGIYITTEEIDHQLEVCWEFDNSRFSLEQIQYYVDLSNMLLSQFIRKPTMPIRDIKWITDKHQVISNQMSRVDSNIDLENNIIKRFRNACDVFNNHIAVSDDSFSLTYGELKQYVDSLSTQLVKEGAKKGDRICLLTDRSANYVIAQLATLQVGGLFVPIDPSLPEDRIKFIVEDCQARLLLTTPEANLPETVSSDYSVLCFSRESLPQVQGFEPPYLYGNDGAYLIYTSGTTGRPKGVVNDHKSLSNLIDWIADDFNYEVGEVFCQFAPFSFDVSIAEILPSVCKGLHVYILSADRRSSPQKYLKTLKEKQVNIATVTPAFFYLFMDDPELVQDCMQTMRIFILGGEALNTKEVQRFQCANPSVQLVNVYGPTETTVLSTFYFLPKFLDMDKQWQPLGNPVANTDIAVLSTSQTPTLLTQTGEIYIGGAGLSQGYWNDVDKTQAAFKKIDIGNGEEVTYYKTGDLARIALDGKLEFVGRSDNQIKIRGFRVELGEIEKVLDNTAEVTQSIVTAIKNPNGQMALAAYYCGEKRDKQYFNSVLSETLPNYMHPDYYCHLDSMPLTHNGKADRKKLPQINFEELASVDYIDPETNLEVQLADIWKNLLKLNRISASDNFFDIGGNSLTAAKLVYTIKDQLSIELRLSDIFANPILHNLAKTLESNESERVQTDRKLTRRNLKEYPVSDAQASMIFTELNADRASLNNMPITLEMETSLDVYRVHDALGALATRHEILGCHFDIQPGGIKQCFEEKSVIEFSIENNVPYENFGIQAKNFHCQTFDIHNGPLWRTQILNSPQGHQWINFSFHHSIADGVTLDLLISDLNKILLDEPMNDLSDSPNYGDYCCWLTENKSNNNHHEEYWANQLPKLRSCDLPMQEPEKILTQGEQYLVDLPKSVSKEFLAFCTSNGLSPFNLFLAIYSHTIAQKIQQHNFTLGLTLSGRHTIEQESITGLFVNTLPLNISFDEKHSLLDQGLAVQRSTIELMEHQSYPLVKVQRLSKSNKPLFNVLFNQEVVRGEMSLMGEKATLMGIGTNTAKFPILVSLMIDESLRWRIEYQTQQLEKTWIEDLQESVIDTIEQFLEMPELPMSSLGQVDDELMALLECEPSGE